MSYRILGLDDDNHAPCFVSETGVGFHNPRHLIEYLAEPHIEKVEVRMFAIVDEWSAQMEAFSEDQVNEMFDALSGASIRPKYITFENCFDMFWDAANRKWW